MPQGEARPEPVRYHIFITVVPSDLISQQTALPKPQQTPEQKLLRSATTTLARKRPQRHAKYHLVCQIVRHIAALGPKRKCKQLGRTGQWSPIAIREHDHQASTTKQRAREVCESVRGPFCC